MEMIHKHNLKILGRTRKGKHMVFGCQTCDYKTNLRIHIVQGLLLRRMYIKKFQKRRRAATAHERR